MLTQAIIALLAIGASVVSAVPAALPGSDLAARQTEDPPNIVVTIGTLNENQQMNIVFPADRNTASQGSSFPISNALLLSGDVRATSEFLEATCAFFSARGRNDPNTGEATCDLATQVGIGRTSEQGTAITMQDPNQVNNEAICIFCQLELE